MNRPEEPMPTDSEANKALVKRFYEEVVSTGNVG